MERFDVDPSVSLAISLTTAPGAYAMFLGSGVSRVAGIPTGWEVTLDLVRKAIGAEGADTSEDPLSWYRERFDKDPDYSEVPPPHRPRTTTKTTIGPPEAYSIAALAARLGGGVRRATIPPVSLRPLARYHAEHPRRCPPYGGHLRTLLPAKPAPFCPRYHSAVPEQLCVVFGSATRWRATFRPDRMPVLRSNPLPRSTASRPAMPPRAALSATARPSRSPSSPRAGLCPYSARPRRPR